MTQSAQSVTPTLIELAPQVTAVVRARVSRDGLTSYVERALATMADDLGGYGRKIVGLPFGRYVPTGDGFDVEVGFPIDAPLSLTARYARGRLPGGLAAAFLVVGGYDEMAEARSAVRRWLATRHLEENGRSWECYLHLGRGASSSHSVVYVPCRPQEHSAPAAGPTSHEQVVVEPEPRGSHGPGRSGLWLLPLERDDVWTEADDHGPLARGDESHDHHPSPRSTGTNGG
ncbi:MAG TPA: GyrI-like domain-containing protein [Nocardioides sp.]|uniref:GyrI-like domain-containing protein n=1 Tax=Nocardioides sp. TaxID=35761 RepID=UPI002BFABE49|nr:GyrI-like domain-containing protein [Nocardioides sp.]HTW13895.1 GyrI-like domain-containing protein [Nocardioides sp.]